MNLREIKELLGDEYEDLEQEARIRCIKYRDNPKYSRILNKTTKNLATNFIRDRAAQKRGGEGFSISTDYSEIKDGHDVDLTVDVRMAVRRITPNEEEANVVLSLLQHQNVTALDCAVALRMPLRTASRYLSWVKVRLRQELEVYR